MKRILITGGSGFLGKRLALDLRENYEVVLASRNNKQNLNAEAITGCKTLPMDVARIESVRDAFLEAKPDIVIHAAATKFVDLSEKQPMECIDVNVIGSQNVARVAIERGIEAVIGISTDKAAPPIYNTYGLSKAMMERMFCALDGDTQFMCVRYGNVVWSTGSVFPIWKSMHADTGVLRSTGPEMTRFFFSVEDAVQLIKTALAERSSLHGKILSQDMKSARISDILDVWVAEKGGRWDRMSGRPGDRPYECLIGQAELAYTGEALFGSRKHYVISPNDARSHAILDVVSSDNTQRLSRGEISQLINDVPREEV
ncbi:MAG: SDR family NAD(P)-dependent oxidoreductase [Myxococcota bacterium]